MIVSHTFLYLSVSGPTNYSLDIVAGVPAQKSGLRMISQYFDKSVCL